jgi:hypothetical protein
MLAVIAMGLLAVIVAVIARNTGETLYNLGFLVLDVLLLPSFGMFILGASVPFASTVVCWLTYCTAILLIELNILCKYWYYCPVIGFQGI